MDLLNEEGISKRRSLKLLDFPKSTYYFNPKNEDEIVVNEIRRLAFKRKRAGYRMIYKFMRKAGWRINHKKVYRLYSR
ncbi:IS3 family transposase, partial [Leptospira soteropolitanensis]